jgi:glycosyltransferase involved in cell wall biosynthesis
MARPRVALFLGFDIRVRGGLTSMADAMLGALARLGIEPDLYMPRLVDSSGSGFAVRSVTAEGRTWNSARTIRGLPNVFGPTLPAARLRARFADYDAVQSVVGSGVWALPGTFARRSLCWIATPFEEEMRSRVRMDSGARRAFYEGLVRIENAAEGAVLRRCDRILALSESTRSIIARRHSLVETDVQLLYAPVDAQAFHAEGATGDEVIVTTSRLDDERKDVPLLIDAFNRVATVRPRCRLKLVGPYEVGGKVHSAVQRSPVRDRIILTGGVSRAEVGGHLRESRVFVLPSLQEGLGIVALEAMACALPVISLPNGGTDEIVTTSGGGRLVRERSAETLAKAIIAMLEEPEAAREMGRRGLSFVATNATMDAFTAGVARAYAALGVPLQ